MGRVHTLPNRILTGSGMFRFVNQKVFDPEPSSWKSDAAITLNQLDTTR